MCRLNTSGERKRLSPVTAAMNTPNRIHSLISMNGNSWNKERKMLMGKDALRISRQRCVLGSGRKRAAVGVNMFMRDISSFERGLRLTHGSL